MGWSWKKSKKLKEQSALPVAGEAEDWMDPREVEEKLRQVGSSWPQERQELARGKRRFRTAFVTTLCTLILLLGMVMVDYQGRKISFGDDTPPVQLRREEDGKRVLEIHTMGWEASWVMPGEVGES